MPYRAIPLVNGEYYHVYNRGVASQATYSSKKNYERFLLCLAYYRFDVPFKLSHLLQIPQSDREELLLQLEKKDQKDVDIIAFALMPNHFHISLQQKVEGGISRFMKKITDSYTRYFNTRYERIGPLFQGAFKAVHIASDEQLIHLSRYIHLNPLVSFVVRDDDFLSYPWSSLKYYLGDKTSFVNTKPILAHFKNPQQYLKFVLDQADYGKKLEQIKHLILEK